MKSDGDPQVKHLSVKQLGQSPKILIGIPECQCNGFSSVSLITFIFPSPSEHISKSYEVVNLGAFGKRR